MSRTEHIRLMAAYNEWGNAKLYDAAQRNFFSLIMHFFSHQAHHRGQATTLLSQAGVDVATHDVFPDLAGDDRLRGGSRRNRAGDCRQAGRQMNKSRGTRHRKAGHRLWTSR